MGGSYKGNTFLEGISVSTGIPLDHINFVASQVISLALAPLMQSVLHPSITKLAARQTFVLIVGIFLGYFAFGIQIIHLVGLPLICYLLLRILNPKIVQRWTMVVAIGYLSCIHLHRLFYSGAAYALDVTGPLMVMTQKITSLAFNIHDGFSKDDLTPNQKYYAIKNIPTVLDYMSYIFHFQTLMAGPVVFYRDYRDFITGANFLKPGTTLADADLSQRDSYIKPDPFYPALKKIAISVTFGVIFSVLKFPIEHAKDEEFFRSGIIYQMAYLYVATTTARYKYYHAWLLADAINNISGLGFNGFTSDGKQKWDLISNVDILGFEFGSSLRDCIQSWNILTNSWLRMVVYERVSKENGVFLTFTLSALWHGFHPGYYLTFATGALFTVASRMVRKYVRPHFQTSSNMRKFYDVLTCLFTRILMTYLTFSFVLLEFWASIRIFWNMYCWLHILALFTIFVLPRFLGQSEAQLRNRLSKQGRFGYKLNLQIIYSMYKTFQIKLE
ncbi:lysophospholipid acyltransferase 6 [Halyomorpha halys]|uniref:lysophospholipid acyltransferase 6 n=1 Tax=Halyomorpha halys TaxID=286706 RepID=UPI0006D50991|nr:lysophospholipid acyltransferase 1 [Halyomorpha halys]